MTGPTAGGVSARARVIHDRALTCLQLARDLGDAGATVKICKEVIAQLRMGRIPTDGAVIHIQAYLRKAFS
jgi:hypothetical protein